MAASQRGGIKEDCESSGPIRYFSSQLIADYTLGRSIFTLPPPLSLSACAVSVFNMTVMLTSTRNGRENVRRTAQRQIGSYFFLITQNTNDREP